MEAHGLATKVLTRGTKRSCWSSERTERREVTGSNSRRIRWRRQHLRHLFNETKTSKQQVTQHFNDFHCLYQVVFSDDVLNLLEKGT